jgi:3',5'-cyclic AMP phosphodiesterase CpdA
MPIDLTPPALRPDRRLLAVSDLHVGIEENRRFLDALRPGNPGDWLIVAGDVSEHSDQIAETLETLARRYAQVVWVPGNHELWSVPGDPIPAKGVARYEQLVEMCRGLGVVTPEDPFPVWDGAGGPVAVAPMFLLYDYTFRVAGTRTKEQSLARAFEAGVVCTDEYRLPSDPYPGRDDWCRARVELTEQRLAAHDPAVPLILVNHHPLIRRPTTLLRYPEFAQWCGTELTADWHRRFNVAVVVYGHLHIPHTGWQDGVRFEEVSVGYPREWRHHGLPKGVLRQILPYSDETTAATSARPSLASRLP